MFSFSLNENHCSLIKIITKCVEDTETYDHDMPNEALGTKLQEAIYSFRSNCKNPCACRSSCMFDHSVFTAACK